MLAAELAAAAPLELRNGTPAEAGLSAERLERAAKLIEGQVASGQVGAASLLVARHGVIALHRGFHADPNAVFLLASITKPVTILSLMLLLERGQVALSDPASAYLPGFTGGERDKIRVRDLASHTSGLPDMLPENIELRRRHALLGEFVQHVYKTPLLFAPRSRFQYQSMGILLASEIVERQTGMRLRDFEQKEI
ncbi:MAG: serine hydrolase, partial [Acidobacteria bacterium]|nr:serine hydrolase [Acidobacteriota bacterium]